MLLGREAAAVFRHDASGCQTVMKALFVSRSGAARVCGLDDARGVPRFDG
jgi:hypothetical protein